MSEDNVVIVGAARTAVGSFNGAFGNTPAHELGAVAIKAALERAKVDPSEVDEVIFGQILTAGQGQNPARQAAMAAGIPQEKTAWGLNQLCGSGLRTVAVGMQQIANGDAKIIVAGGQESMSQAPHAAYMRGGTKMGDLKMSDTMLKDGLMDAFQGYHMGTTAENVAAEVAAHPRGAGSVRRRNPRTRQRPPRRPASSRTRSFPSPSRPARATPLSTRTNTSAPARPPKSLGKLKPAFSKDGTVTAGNASGINDGAAAIVLMSESEAKKRGLKPLARIVSWATAGVDPAVMGTGPDPGFPQGAGKGRLESLRSRPRRGQRGLRRSGACRQQGHGLGSGDRERQWRRDRHRASHRRIRRTRAGDAAA